MSERIEELERRVVALEDAVARLDNRTLPMQVIGPTSQHSTHVNRNLLKALDDLPEEAIQGIRDRINELDQETPNE